MPTTAKKNDLLEYKGHPLMRKENIIYYGSMSDSHIIMMQILDAGEVKAPADKPQCPHERAYCEKNRKR